MSEVLRFVKNLPFIIKPTWLSSDKWNFLFNFFVSRFCYPVLGGTCEKCLKFYTLGENLTFSLKSKKFGSVFAHFDCLLTKGSFIYSLVTIITSFWVGHVKNFWSSSLWARIRSLFYNQQIFGQFLLILTVFRQREY